MIGLFFLDLAGYIVLGIIALATANMTMLKLALSAWVIMLVVGLLAIVTLPKNPA